MSDVVGICHQMNFPSGLFAEMVYSRNKGSIILFSKSLQLVNYSSLEIQLASVTAPFCVLGCFSARAPGEQSKGNTRVVRTGHKADTAEGAVWEYF